MSNPIVGAGRHTFEVHEDWARPPEGCEMMAASVTVDTDDRVYCFNRDKTHSVMVFNRDGSYVTSWGAGQFAFAHTIRAAKDGNLWLVDRDHAQMYLYTRSGELLRTIGVKGHRSETGVAPDDFRSDAFLRVKHGGGPFNLPTDIDVAASGEFFVTDGYGNARVHKYSKEGKLLFSWGEPGQGPGQFILPHGIAVDSSGLVYVADRENSRVQVFKGDGEYVREWGWLNRPYDIFIDDQDMLHIAEGGFHNYMMKRSEGPLPAHDQTMIYPPCGHSPIARVTVCDPDGKIAAQVGGENPVLPGNFVAPHGIWADKRGDFYVGEVIVNAGAVKRMAPLRPAGFQKFRRRAG